jgi:uncharacterized protein YdaU (DUF1376 family)
MRHKRIKYISLEAGAFISDLIFQTMTAAERGVYCTLIFYLYENNGRLPFDIESLKHLCNCQDFEKVWEFIKQKFIIKNGKISHKRVSKELDRAKKLSQVQTEKAVKAAVKRWQNDTPSNAPSNASSIAKRSNEKRSEDKVSENIETCPVRNDQPLKVNNCEGNSCAAEFTNLTKPAISNGASVRTITKGLLPSVRDISKRPDIASQIQCLKSSTRLDPLEAGRQRQPTAAIGSRPLTGPAPSAAEQPDTVIFYDRLAGVFGGRTPADSTALRNLTRWLSDCVATGVFTKSIYQRVIDMAADSKNGSSRKPIAVFFAQVKRDLGYKSEKS